MELKIKIAFIFILFLLYIISTICELFGDTWIHYWTKRKIKKQLRNQDIETVGVVSGSHMILKWKLHSFFFTKHKGSEWKKQSAMQEYEVTDSFNKFFSPIVTYQDKYGESHEINALYYRRHKPVVGRRVKVCYGMDSPKTAYVWTKREYKGPLKVEDVDEFYAQCSQGWRRNIQIPMSLVEDELEPGSILLEEYGFYHSLICIIPKWRKHLQVETVGEHVARCRYGRIRNIRVPLNLIEDKIAPGDYIVEQFDRYYLDPGDATPVLKNL